MLMLTAYLQQKQNGTLKTPALASVDLKPNGSDRVSYGVNTDVLDVDKVNIV